MPLPFGNYYDVTHEVKGASFLDVYANNSNSLTINYRGECFEEERIFTNHDSVSCRNLGGLWLQ